MEGRIVKGIWIPIEIWKNAELSWNEKILLMEIDSFTNNEKDFFMSDERIAELLDTSERNASRMVSNLIKKGYIERSRYDGRQRFLRSLIRYDKIGESDPPKMASQKRQECRNTNNSLLKDTLDKSKVAHIKDSKRFVKPSIEEVADYCRERGNAVDPERFWNFYESKGWMVGKSKMKDWKACVRTWEKPDQRQEQQKPKGRKRYKQSFLEQVKVAEDMFGSEYAKAVYGVSYYEESNMTPDEQ